MASTRIKRGAKPAPPKRRFKLPALSPRTRRALMIGVPALLATAGVATAVIADVPARMRASLALESAAAGFEIHHVEVQGAREVPRMVVYNAVLQGTSNPLLGADLAAIRAELQRHPWVADASVSRRLPDTLVVRLAERQPVALWQHRQRFHLIDIGGRVLGTGDLDRFAGLPLVVGPGANHQIADWLTLTAASPQLAGRIEAGVLVGERRWNVHFKSGETLALPDTPDGARAALTRFAGLEADLPPNRKLLGTHFERFDMRVPGQLIVGGP
ncbi:cell division protein FtsQ/DivIB, partial [Polymorphobacter multimanifer]